MRIAVGLERLKASAGAHGFFGIQGKRLAGLAALIALGLLLFNGTLRDLYRFSSAGEQYSHILLIPFIAAYLLFRERGSMSRRATTYSWAASLPFFVASGVLSWAVRYFSTPEARLQMSVLSFITFLFAAFVVCLGRQSAVPRFPFFFLLFMAPAPTLVLDKVISLLQAGSAGASQVLFDLAGAPVLREGLLFSLPGLKIEIAKECSGIRSSIALVICSLLMAHCQLRSAWTKAALLLAVIPVVVMKNAIRIVSLSLLAVYVDRDFVTGGLHNKGGVIFFVLALFLMMLLLRVGCALEDRRGAAIKPQGRAKAITASPGIVTEIEKA